MGHRARMGVNMAQSRRDDAQNITNAHDIGPGIVAHYREYAAQIRDLADREQDIDLRDRLKALADRYEARADQIEPPQP